MTAFKTERDLKKNDKNQIKKTYFCTYIYCLLELWILVWYGIKDDVVTWC